jgi:LPP20 lipoprotein
MKRIVLIFTVSVFCLQGCFGNKKPKWITYRDKEYTKAEYIMGVGESYSMDLAKKYAVAEIAKVFSSEVMSSASFYESETDSSTSEDTQATASSQNASQRVNTKTDKVIEGAQIAESWFDKENNRYYALAVLNREKASAKLKEQIASMDEKISWFESEIPKASSKFNKIKAGLNVLSLLNMRESLISDLQIINPSGKSEVSDLGALHTRMIKMLQSLDILVQVDGDVMDRVGGAIVQGLNDMGFSVRLEKTAKKSDIIINAKVEIIELPGTSNKLNWVRANTNVIINDVVSNNTFMAFDVSERAAALNYDDATSRALVGVGKKAVEKIKSGVLNYFNRF